MVCPSRYRFFSALVFFGTLALAACLNAPARAPVVTFASTSPLLQPTATLAVTHTATATQSSQSPLRSKAGLLQIYQNPVAGFSLRLPEDWTVGQPQRVAYGTLYLLGPAPLARSGPVNSSIIIADRATLTFTELAEQIQCGGGCVALTLTHVLLRNNIPAQYAVIGGAGSPTLPWYFVEHKGMVIAFSLHDPERPTQTLDAILQSLTLGPLVGTGDEESAAAQAARQAVAHMLGINPYVVLLESLTSVQWPDSCLGVYHTSQVCTQQATPGFIVGLSALGKQYQYNTNQNGAEVVAGRTSPNNRPALAWHRAGGFAGFCDDIAVYITGFAQATSCKGGQARDRGRQALTADQWTQLDRWVDSLQSFKLEQQDPLGASDALSVTLLFRGNGAQPASMAQKQAIQTFAGQLYAQFTAIPAPTPTVTLPLLDAPASSVITD